MSSTSENEDVYFTGSLTAGELIAPFLKVLNDTPDRVRTRLLERYQTQSWTEAALRISQSGSAVSDACMFRRSSSADDLLSSLWLAEVADLTTKKLLEFPQPPERGTINQADLRSIAQLCSNCEPAEILKRIAVEFGVLVVVCPAQSGTKADGVAFNLFGTIRAIGLSLRYSRYDYFVFTLLHELAHHCMHLAPDSAPILDDLDDRSDAEIEVQANRLAADSIVPRALMERAKVLRTKSEQDLMDLSRAANAHPIVVAGLVRRRLNDYRLFSNIVHEVNVRQILGMDRQ
jgi:HTH-type transcriptional regulator / antitoxin HigA